MSTQALPPLEQLEQQQPLSPIERLAAMGNQQPSTPSKPDDNLSPIERLEAMGQQQPPQPQADPDQKTASDTRQMLVSGLTGMPTPNMTDADRASFANGKAAGAGTATLLSAAPLLGALAPHLPDLDKAWKIAAALMGGSATVDHVVHVLKTLRGKYSELLRRQQIYVQFPHLLGELPCLPILK